MADPIPGELEEWAEIEPTRWARTDHPEDGVIMPDPAADLRGILRRAGQRSGPAAGAWKRCRRPAPSSTPSRRGSRRWKQSKG